MSRPTFARRALRGLAALSLLGLTAAAPSLPDVVDEALGMKNRAAGVQLLEQALKDASPEETPWLLLYAAELDRLAGETRSARAAFQRVTEEFPASGAKDPAILGLTVIDAGDDASGNSLATLALIGDKNVPDTLNADRYLLLARAKAAEGADPSAVRALADKAEKYAASAKDVSRRVGKAVDALAVAPAPAAPAGKGPPDQAAIEAIRAAVRAGDLAKAGELAASFAERFPDSPHAREAAYAKRRADAGVRVDPDRVAVLLPSSVGTYAVIAESLRAAIELGNAHGGSRLELVFHDTGGTGEGCVKALEQAALKDGASLVIGPLLKEEALGCAPAAQALRLPMLTLTSSEEVLAAGDQVFRAFPSTEQLVDALLDETYDVRGITRYAVLHPTTSFGENAARIFAEAVEKRGGTVAARQGYDPAAKDFRAPAKALGKKDYKARAGEYAQLRAAATRAKADPDKVVLPPVIDYQAIFIPDNYQRVALIASALAFEEFPVGRFRPRREDTPMPLLGLNAWNNDELARRGGAYVLDSIFVDAFDPRVDDAATDAFLDAWKERGKGDATVVEAVAYDTARLVSLVVTGGEDPAAALRTARLPDPIAGAAGFGEDRQMERSWRLLTVTKEGVGPLQPPEPPEPENAGQ